jgi:hypothetical protein
LAGSKNTTVSTPVSGSTKRSPARVLHHAIGGVAACLFQHPVCSLI